MRVTAVSVSVLLVVSCLSGCSVLSGAFKPAHSSDSSSSSAGDDVNACKIFGDSTIRLTALMTNKDKTQEEKQQGAVHFRDQIAKAVTVAKDAELKKQLTAIRDNYDRAMTLGNQITTPEAEEIQTSTSQAAQVAFDRCKEIEK